MEKRITLSNININNPIFDSISYKLINYIK